MGLSLRCIIQSFIEIGPLAPEKKIYLFIYFLFIFFFFFFFFLVGGGGVFFIYGHGSHPGHGISTLLMHFHFIVPKSLHRKCG